MALLAASKSGPYTIVYCSNYCLRMTKNYSHRTGIGKTYQTTSIWVNWKMYWQLWCRCYRKFLEKIYLMVHFSPYVNLIRTLV